MFLLFTVCKQCQVSTQVSTLALTLPQTALYEVVYSQFLLRKRYLVLNITQPLPNLCKGCTPWNFMQVKFYLSQNFPKLNSVQFNFFYIMCRKKFKMRATKCTIKGLRQHCLCVFAALATTSIYFL